MKICDLGEGEGVKDVSDQIKTEYQVVEGHRAHIQ